MVLHLYLQALAPLGAMGPAHPSTQALMGHTDSSSWNETETEINEFLGKPC